MKRLLVVLFLAVVGLVTADAQETNPKKAFKQAKRNRSAFELDNAKVDELKDAVKLVGVAARDQEMGELSEVWIEMGDIYSAFLELDYKNSLMDENYKSQYLQEANKAYMAYKKGFELADKSRDSKLALEGMAGLVQSMSNSGITVLQAGDAMGAYNIFKNVLDIDALLSENGIDSPLQGEEAKNNQLFLAGYSALIGEQFSLAKPYYTQLKDNNYDDPSLYEGLYKIALSESPETASAILEEGREKYPDDLSLLYAEINHALQNNEIGTLETKLKEAIKKDPKNVSLYSTTGSVYDRLFQETMDTDAAKANSYFDSAKVYFEKGLELDPDNVDAIYSIGALFYNKAAQGTQQLQELADDLSSAGMKKYDSTKAEVDKIFDQALPYFQKAERVNPSDRNTLIALKEIYARKNQMDVSDIFSARLEQIERGETIAESYFKSQD
ncbi:tetratricopeptide repeat protein [Membranihabitans marinus]|uniref:hypothetical protein n=1 Tax=Membranihabitans marinus TaxID=1227546 RepID=UPI001F437C45|nr:hypothetical protein [Membranihabitans marinus]